MKILYLDCFSGISGDMFLAAMLDAGMEFSGFKDQIKKMALPGVELKQSSVRGEGISGTRFEVKVKPAKASHRHLEDIFRVIQKSRLSSSIKDRASAMFQRLAMVEAKVHGTTPQHIHFHEVGAIDSIIDITGAVIALEMMEIKEVYCSEVPLGKGEIQTEHGRLPVPAPATLALLKGFPLHWDSPTGELVTPTGALILSSFCQPHVSAPVFLSDSIGYGYGQRRGIEKPNFLRVCLGDVSSDPQREHISVLETQIDDMNPAIFGYLMELLFQAGAKDVFLTPIIMKKNRPGTLLTVLAEHPVVRKLSHLIFRETTSIGLRISEHGRVMLKRQIKTVSTQLGPAKVKMIELDGQVQLMPEYDECVRLAKKHKLPLKEVYQKVHDASQRL